MRQAAENDQEANANSQPATSKLRLLPELKQILANPSIANTAIDNSIMDEIRMWLEPLRTTNVLPAYEIQKELFKWLETIHPSTDILRESGIGKIVLFYTKDARPQNHIKKSATNLVLEWSRPILGKSADYKTKPVQMAEYDPEYVSNYPNLNATNIDTARSILEPSAKQSRSQMPLRLPRATQIALVFRCLWQTATRLLQRA